MAASITHTTTTPCPRCGATATASMHVERPEDGAPQRSLSLRCPHHCSLDTQELAALAGRLAPAREPD
jgi:hypothetical protein